MMRWQVVRRTWLVAYLLIASVAMTGCWHVKPDPLFCGDGTVERWVNDERTCVVAPLTCGDGTQEQATGGERECVATGTRGLLACGEGTHQQEQATGGERECVSGETSCGAGEIEYVTEDGEKRCRTVLTCANGTYEQATGGERECVPIDSVAKCGDGTYEQATGGEREQATGGERECAPNNRN